MLLFLCICQSAKAGLDNDTTQQSSYLPQHTNDLPQVVAKKANVRYPVILAQHQSQTIGYIEKFSQQRKGYLMRTYQRSKKFFPKVETILGKYQIPREFRVLLALESGFNSNAVSSAGAVGYWQIMDEVAKEYGMRIAAKNKKYKAISDKKKKNVAKTVKADKKKEVVDDRKNFIKSTHVAARYLKDRCRNLQNDWLLIAASYNCGVGNVWNAMERSGKNSPTFWDIKDLLPAETRAYVLNFIALNVIFYNYEAFATNNLCFRDEICIPEEDDMAPCEEDMVIVETNDY